jgi:hypothetical protein
LRGRLPAWFAVLLAIAIAAAFFLATWELWALADNDSAQQVWDRRDALFQTLSSLFGAVVGAVFGVSVIQPRAARAEQRADSAERDARRHAADAARSKGDVGTAVERARTDILRLAAVASWTDPEMVIDPETQGEDGARSSLQMALDHPGPVNLVQRPTAGGAAPVLALADLAAIIEESRTGEPES